LVQALNHCFPSKKKMFIFGASNDHSLGDMLEVLLPVSDPMFMVASRHPRAETPERLAAMAEEMGGRTMPVSGISIALERAIAEASQDGLICVTGSLFLVADAREVWLQRNGLPLPPIGQFEER
jgi:dihydrofolate synthase/folylpolyglutamate synthase